MFMARVSGTTANAAGRKVTGMLAENFYVRKSDGEYSFIHAARRMQSDRFRFPDVLKAVNSGDIVTYRGKDQAILELGDGRLLAVPLASDTDKYGKIVTAFVLSKARADKLRAAPKSAYKRDTIWMFKRRD